ncbi:acetylcholine receptor subunit beta-like [Symsagittifera roscoffensis]|uniref:acetylcholine receptor subunit beta-like n=1 Tax=Symsagittifera roscoffensis TaxID=84072 RepID=UPI00307BEF0B
MVFVYPSVLLYLLSSVTFFIPPDSGEKVSFAVTILLTEIVSYGTLLTILPASSHHVPYLIYFIASATFHLTCNCVAAAAVVNIHHNSSSLTMYNWLQVLITSNHVIYLGLKPSPVKASHLTLPKHSDGSSGMNMESPLHVQSMDQVNSPPPSKKHDNDTQITQQLAKKRAMKTRSHHCNGNNWPLL